MVVVVLVASTADQGLEDLNFGGLVFNGKVTLNSFFFFKFKIKLIIAYRVISEGLMFF